jgi:hypothetical protein
MRAQITCLGGEVRFNQKLETIYRQKTTNDEGQITGVTLANGGHLRKQTCHISHRPKHTRQL